ncbi:hypothetical protein BDC45DRAFT_537851 [Circinella umbellata]|nr:hypothetical protein BDC45DRAFT_537851 [Circinella umbellata]
MSDHTARTITKPYRKPTTEEVRKAVDSFRLSPKNFLRQAKENEQYYRQQFARVNKLCESLRAEVKELETALEKKTTQPPPFLSTHSVFSMSLSPVSTTLDKPKTTLPQTSPQPTSSKLSPTKSHQKQPTVNHEATPLSANNRIKQARPAPTTSTSPNKKLRQVIDNISFPGRNIIGLLVHRHCLPEIISIMQIPKIPVLKDFDSTHPDNLKDPKYKKMFRSRMRYYFQAMSSNSMPARHCNTTFYPDWWCTFNALL